MKVLWITNIPLPPICQAMGWMVPAIGGWMYSSLKRLIGVKNDMSIAVSTVYSGNEFITKEINGIIWYLLPLKGKNKNKYNFHLEDYWNRIKNNFNPDIIHLHGSEFPHGLAYVNACSNKGVVVSIQGMVSVISRYYSAGISNKEARNCTTFRDIIKNDGIFKGQRNFEERGKYEVSLIKKVTNVIGRTDWDRAQTWAINPDRNYYFCGETLRDSFYKHQWTYENCIPNSIFISQAGYPIKGLHKVLMALPLVIRKYPDVTVNIAGQDIINRPWWRITGYGKYLQTLIRKNKLQDHIKFTGILSEEEMCKAYLKANLFICPSSIENSPNSLGEAQLLGMPYLTSFVGGSPEIVNYSSNALYRFEETEMLAEKIIEIFDMKSNFNPIACDLSRYNHELNTKNLLDTYNSIIHTS